MSTGFREKSGERQTRVEPVKVHLGCGPEKMPGYINVDADPAVGPDLVAPAWAIPLAAESVDLLEAYHVIEHLPPWLIEGTIREWRRVLKPGGKVVVECPDLSKVVEWLARTKDFSGYSSLGMSPLFGEITSKNEFMIHKWGFTPETIRYLFSSLGFDPVLLCLPQTHMPDRDLRVEAIKGTCAADTLPPMRVSWFLRGDESVASSRLHGYLIHQWLCQQGIASELVLSPPSHTIADIPWDWTQHWRVLKLVRSGIAVFQKLEGPRTVTLIRYLRAAGATTVYVDADYNPANPVGLECDVVVCPSNAHAEHYRRLGVKSVVMIQDPVEFWLPPPSAAQHLAKTSGLRIGWVGHSANWETLGIVKEVLREPEFSDLRLVTISDHAQADIRWKLSLFPNVFRDFDLAVIPTATDAAAAVKSANRLTMFMAAGLPVITGRIRAYEEVLIPGVNGFLASDYEEWRHALRQLRQPEVRHRIAVAAYEKARRDFSLDCIGKEWLRLFAQLNHRSASNDWLHGPISLMDRRHTQKILDCLSLAYCAEEALHNRRLGTAGAYFVRALPTMLRNPDCLARWGALLSRALRFTLGSFVQCKSDHR